MKIIKNKEFTGDGLYLHEDTHIINCKFHHIEGFNHHGMELHGDGKQIEYLIEDCVIDNLGINPEDYDEGVALVNAPIVTFSRCRFAHLGKACLVGNGDHNENDKKLRVTFNECIFENCGRRSPFIQFGEAVLNDCLIMNWGDPDYFYLKSHGLRVGSAAKCEVNRTIFIQQHFWPGFKNFFTDIVNQYDPILIPGNCRAAYAEKGGELILNNCLFDGKFIWTRGEINNTENINDWGERIVELQNEVPALN